MPGRARCPSPRCRGGSSSSATRSRLDSAETENYSHSYAAATAQALGAEQSAISASGVGVYRNWGATTLNTAADLYERALPTQVSSRWSFGLWKPDVVVINLGTSDFTSGDPGSTPFLTAYRALVARVRKNNPSALIVIALGPMLSDLWPAGAQALTRSRAYLSTLVSELNAAGDPRVKLLEVTNQDSATSFGCKSHPSATTHRLVAAQLTQFLRQQVGW
jgi:lysophospholipase L1-like esterase